MLLLEQFKLPPFASRRAARDFWVRNDEHKFAMRQFFLYFGALAFLGHGILDLTAGGEQATLLFSMRCVSVMAMLVLAVNFTRGVERVRPDSVVLAYLAVPAVAIIAMTVVAHEGTVADTYPFGLVILFAYGGTVLVPRSIKMIGLCTATYLLYLASIPFSAISASALIINLFFVTVGIAAVGIGSLTRERMERMQFKFEQSIVELNHDLKFSREEALVARDTAIDAKQTQAKFIASISHELRTPLNAIIGFSDLMMNEIDGPVTPPSYEGYIADIHRSGRGLLLNINDLLDVHRLNAGKMSWSDERFSIDEMVRNAASDCRHEADDAGVILVSERPQEPTDAFGDINRMTQVISNLLTNAIKFTETGGRVVVTQTLEPSGELRISVSDTGIGIAAEDLNRIRDPFQQAEDGSLAKKKGGLGLGLAIVGGILEQIDGRFEIESELGVGTFCHVFIPRDKLFANDAEASVA